MSSLRFRLLGTASLLAFASMGCGTDDTAGTAAGGASNGGSGGSEPGGGTGGSDPDNPTPGVSEECGSVRMTEYGATDRRWCGFDRTDSLLPEFVRAGMTVAIAEPYAGGSYDGEVGEACGECWELSTTFATQIVMVHDLCPVEGNPVCSGSHFHFDVAAEVASAIDGGGWLGEGAVRRVPCPVTGNIHAYVSDRNVYGYLKVAFFNHRFPIRTVEYQPVGSSEWRSMQRCLARWCVEDDNATFSEDGPGAVFRITSALGEAVEGAAMLTYDVETGASFDTGVQFAPAQAQGPACTFVPPAAVYDEGWGGIDGVRWQPNPWGGTELTEIGDGCVQGSSCLLLSSLQGGGLHVTYRHVFPTETFTRLSLQVRAHSGAGTVEVAPRSEDVRCANPTTVAVDDAWTLVDIDVPQSCPDTDMIQGLTISRASAPMDLVVDEVFFIP